MSETTIQSLLASAMGGDYSTSTTKTTGKTGSIPGSSLAQRLNKEKEERKIATGPKCYTCGQTGHFKTECLARFTCSICSKKGHLKRDCPDRCLTCQRSHTSHSVSNCRVTCMLCGERGHNETNCDSPYIYHNKTVLDVVQGKAA